MRTDGRLIHEIFASKTILPNFLIYNCHRARGDITPHKSEENVSSTSAGRELFSKGLPSPHTSASGGGSARQTTQSTTGV